MRISDWSSDVCSSDLDVLAAVTIAILCAAFLLETRAHRNLFYLAALPVFLLRLPTFDWRSLADSLIARLALAYIGYFLLSALWSDGFSWPAFADLLRVTLLLLLFFLVTFSLASEDGGFDSRLFFWFARSEEHTSELPSLMRISYAVFCLKK